MSDVPEIVKQAVQRMIATIGVHGKFKIVLNDGTEYGDLPVAIDKPVKRHRVNKGIVDYDRPFLLNTKAGEVAVIPSTPQFPSTAVSATATAKASQMWGNGSYQSMTNRANGNIELLRLS